MDCVRARRAQRGADRVLDLFGDRRPLLLIYALQSKDPVFIAGLGLSLFIYLRNLQFILRGRKSAPA